MATSKVHPINPERRLVKKVFDPTRHLPPVLRVPSSDTMLFEIGLDYIPLKPDVQRKLINHPLFITTFIFPFILAKIASVFVKDRLILNLLGDSAQFFGMKVYFNVMLALFASLIFTSQTIYFYNYMRGVRPTFLRVFQMLSGVLTPSDVGLTNEQDLLRFVILSKKLFHYYKINCDYFSPFQVIMRKEVSIYIAIILKT